MSIDECASAPGVQKLPPKLQQLLDLIPDVDKVNLLHIARQYQMDLDDPGFLPLLLTTQGIAALDASRKSLIDESERTTSLALNRGCDAINICAESAKSSLNSFQEKSIIYIKERIADSEKALHEALAIWSNEALSDSISAALIKNSEQATAEATRIANEAADNLAATARDAEKSAINAAKICNAAANEVSESLSSLKPILLTVIFLLGVAIGAAGIMLAKRPRASDVYLDVEAVANKVISSCVKTQK